MNVLLQDVAAEEKTITKEPLCKQKLHKKVLEKGVPDDVMVGIKNVKVSILNYRYVFILSH